MITIFCDFWGIFREIFFSQKPILLSLFQQNYFLFESKMPIFCEIFLRIKKIRTSVRGQLKMVDFVPAAGSVVWQPPQYQKISGSNPAGVKVFCDSMHCFGVNSN
jgi:hypothetical protein